jgi:hypothetical protein
MGLKQGLVYLEEQAVTFSGTNMDLTGSLVTVNFATTGSVSDSLGRFKVTSIGSPAVYGGIIQVGSTVTSAGSIGTIVFGREFSNTQYRIVISNVATSGLGFISGALRASGCEVVGGPAVVYNYVAVGL